MRISKKSTEVYQGDLTPMIDMTFQLIAFFMVLINFSQAESNDKITLPESILAKPPEGALDYPITLHLTSDGSVIVGGEEVPVGELRPLLIREGQIMDLKNKPRSDATIIIRGDQGAQVGRVQELIQLCQQERFESFALRAKEKVEY